MATKYKVEVNTAGDPEDAWNNNALRFDTEEEAKVYGKDLFMHWTAVKHWRVVPEKTGEPNE